MKRLLCSILAIVIMAAMLPLNGSLGSFIVSPVISKAIDEAPVFSLNIIDETSSAVTLAVRLDSGAFSSVDLTVNAAGRNIGKCTFAIESDAFLNYMMKDIKKLGGTGSSAIYANTGKLSAALTIAFNKAGTDIAEFTFAKNTADKVTKSDVTLNVLSCELDLAKVIAKTVNNLPADAHVHSYKSVVTAPTCTAQGYTTYTCSGCGYSYKSNYVSALGHSYGAWTVTKAATSASTGIKERKCSRCGAVETEVIPKLSTPEIYKTTFDNQGATTSGTTAVWFKYNTVENGNYYYSDSKCTQPITSGYRITCPTKQNYKFGGYFTGKNGTGTQYVSENGTCINNMYRIAESRTLYAYWIASHTHSYVSKVTKAATCTEAGIRTFTCSCGSSYTETIPAAGHSYVKHVVEPTCTAEGYTYYTCKNCDLYAPTSAKTPATGHSYVKHVVEPTCTEEGYTYYTCEHCNLYAPTSEKTPATGHSYGEWKVTRAATETATGLKEHKCSKCGAVETQVIPKLTPQQTQVTLNNHDISLNYKETSVLKASSDNVTWSSSNAKVVSVDNNGNIKATGTGSAIITVTDNANGTTDSCRVNASFAWWQWIIEIALFGWIWY